MDINIALLPGDGIGPEIIAEATKVLDRTAAKFGHRIRYTEALVGAAAIDATGNPYPDTTHCICPRGRRRAVRRHRRSQIRQQPQSEGSSRTGVAAYAPRPWGSSPTCVR